MLLAVHSHPAPCSSLFSPFILPRIPTLSPVCLGIVKALSNYQLPWWTFLDFPKHPGYQAFQHLQPCYGTLPVKVTRYKAPALVPKEKGPGSLQPPAKVLIDNRRAINQLLTEWITGRHIRIINPNLSVTKTQFWISSFIYEICLFSALR